MNKVRNGLRLPAPPIAARLDPETVSCSSGNSLRLPVLRGALPSLAPCPIYLKLKA